MVIKMCLKDVGIPKDAFDALMDAVVKDVTAFCNNLKRTIDVDNDNLVSINEIIRTLKGFFSRIIRTVKKCRKM